MRFGVTILVLLTAALLLGPLFLTGPAQLAVAGALIVPLLAWWALARRRSRIARLAVASLALLIAWDLMLVAAARLQLSAAHNAVFQYGLGGLFLIGLLWTIWIVEQASQFYENRRRALEPTGYAGNLAETVASASGKKIWNPLDPAAWYYGRQRQRLNQSTILLAAYSLLFLVVNVVVSYAASGRESYQLPGGGGGGGSSGGGAQQMARAQTVRVKKVIKKKFVINPFSAIKFANAEIDDVKLELNQATDHLYAAGQGLGGAGSGKGKGFGYGDGDGSGFGPGTSGGKVRLIRLEYSGGDWNQDFGVGADLNMLIEYGVRTGQPVSDRTESRTVAQLASFPPEQSPPMMYLTGQGNISFAKPEIKSLRSYLLDKHGMLFGDNGGSQHFHNQFFAMMRQVLPDVEPVRIPLDDQIHRVPFAIPFLPYVAPHGGKDAWGWKVDGRWVCYYHPGDIGDAWSDGHSGVPREVWDACYRLGVNVIFYAHVEYAKWLEARHKK